MAKIWSPDYKFWSPTYLIYDLRKNIILNVTLHARKVIINKLNSTKKKKNSTRKTSEATVVLDFYL